MKSTEEQKKRTHQLLGEIAPTFLNWRCCLLHSNHYSNGFQSQAETSPRRGSGSESWCRGMHSTLPPPPAVLTSAKWLETTLTTGSTVKFMMVQWKWASITPLFCLYLSANNPHWNLAKREWLHHLYRVLSFFLLFFLCLIEIFTKWLEATKTLSLVQSIVFF